MQRFKIIIFLVFFFNISNAQTSFDSLVLNINKNSFDYYKKFSKNADNEVFSPYFFSISLSEIFLATKGGTDRQVSEFQGFSMNKATHFQDMIKLQNIVFENNNLNTNFKYSLNVFIDDSLKIVDKFAENLKSYPLCDSLRRISFKASKTEIIQKHNEIISNNSNIDLKDFMTNDIFPDTPVILVSSAVNFYGILSKKFPFYYYSDFYEKNNEKIDKNVKYLTTFDYFNYGEGDNYQIVELPYQGDRFSLFIILPQNNTSLDSFKNNFNFGYFLMWRQKNMFRQLTRVLVPEISVESFYSLKNQLDTVFPAVFQRGGNFTNLARRLIYVNGFYHYSRLSFLNNDPKIKELKFYDFENEKTENESFIFNANHPFLFIVFDNRSQVILFIGHISNPK